MRSLVLGVIALASVAGADPAPESKVEVEVGKTVERDVGVLRTYFCDDPTLITSSLVTRGEVNVWIVTGVKIGTTQCRIGTRFQPPRVFDVAVIAAKASPG